MNSHLDSTVAYCIRIVFVLVLIAQLVFVVRVCVCVCCAHVGVVARVYVRA